MTNHTEESLMALADFAIGHQVRVAYGQRPCNASESRNALCLAIRKVLAECERLRKDAERYRWLRDKCDAYQSPDDCWILQANGQEWDAAIDAAMQRKQP